MASENRSAEDCLVLLQDLEKTPYRFGFFQALRLIECAYSEQPRIGASARAADDPVRFGQRPSMAFAPSTLAAFQASPSGSLPRLDVLFFGLFGPNGPLPLHLTEYVHDRINNASDETLARFCDIFHHRLLSLFYRAWADAQPVSNLDRPETDAFARRLGALVGIGTPALRARDELPDHAKLFFAGRLGLQTRNAEGLLAMLSSYFHMPVNLEQYIGDWLTIPQENCLRLGESLDTGALGQTTTLGGRVWECQHKFRLTFGPLSLDDYQRMLPGGSSLLRLVALVRNYVADEFDWEVHLILDSDQAQPTQLGGFGQLGWTSWLLDEAPPSDPGALFFNPMQGC